jgi:hypothetical protein
VNVKIGTEDIQPNGSLDSELRSSAQESTFLDKCVGFGSCLSRNVEEHISVGTLTSIPTNTDCRIPSLSIVDA